jgi:hypothetical protein
LLGTDTTGVQRAEVAEKQFTKAEVKERISGLPEAIAKAIVCAMVGHSRIQTACFGYYNCGRCFEQVGDTLGSSYPGAKLAVVIGHDCETCRENAKTLTWRDTFMAPDPFKAEGQP